MLNFQAIIKEHHPILFKIGRAYSGEEDFDDLYQEMLIAIWKSLKNFKGDSKISTWLYRVVLNTALNYRRKQKFSLFEKSSVKEVENLPHSPDNHYLEKEEKINELYVAIRKLNRDERSIILLYLEGKEYAEIAEIIGISKTNVGVKINRIKKKLFNLLNK